MMREKSIKDEVLSWVQNVACALSSDGSEFYISTYGKYSLIFYAHTTACYRSVTLNKSRNHAVLKVCNHGHKTAQYTQKEIVVVSVGSIIYMHESPYGTAFIRYSRLELSSLTDPERQIRLWVKK